MTDARPAKAAIAPPTILYHHRIASHDGQAVHIEEVTRALGELGCRVVVVGPPAFHRLSVGRSIPGIDRMKSLLPRTLYEALEIGYALWSYARLLAAWMKHRPDLLYERYNLFEPAGAWLKRTVGIPFLLEVNAPLLVERPATDGLALKRLAAWSERATLRSADRVLPVSHALADILAGAGVPRERILVVPNGADPARFSDDPGVFAERRRRGLDGRIVLGFSGFVRPWHRLDRVLDLIASGPMAEAFHLLVIGAGPAAETLRRQAEELKISERLTVTGPVDRERLPGLLSLVDIALQPGATDYASPLKLFEYMAAGRAIVAPNLPNIREILDPSCAELFDPADPDAFKAAVLRLARDEGYRLRLGAAARRRIAERGYTWRDNARRILEAGAVLLECRPAGRPAQARFLEDR
jgi:glycosyltransferase involved in cell wall biosynthesis